ncbi:hypothetical protein CDEST_05783 [Colletotrichum destructivum]|uniref:Secreted protein n=1 Tax=Colletotrichum destructivum TaxID=34406 RepID=A0AAX4ICS5_9PEZI|nr:hypothetical protein CDEST_05783 [Colletotrichum destructivum]
MRAEVLHRPRLCLASVMIATTAAANPVAAQEFVADDHPSTVTEVITSSAHSITTTTPNSPPPRLRQRLRRRVLRHSLRRRFCELHLDWGRYGRYHAVEIGRSQHLHQLRLSIPERPIELHFQLRRFFGHQRCRADRLPRLNTTRIGFSNNSRNDIVSSQLSTRSASWQLLLAVQSTRLSVVMVAR